MSKPVFSYFHKPEHVLSGKDKKKNKKKKKKIDIWHLTHLLQIKSYTN